VTRTAVFSDIHGNLEALSAVCQAGARLGVDGWLCLGDVVGYGADPGACLDGARSLTEVVLQGNHDAAVAGVQSVEYFNRNARRAVEWTRGCLSDAQRTELTGWALTHVEGDAFYVHAEPSDPAAWHYVNDVADAAAALAASGSRLIFVGHSHRGFVCAARDGRVVEAAEGSGSLELAADTRYLVNVGSVGQPRDGDPRACFAIHDDEAGTVELVRTAYDVARAQGKILDAGLPRFLAERLSEGI
jgi:diadenosine tetraphosphatase ApaH/serine/threonine PP2A family protein phosphatase